MHRGICGMQSWSRLMATWVLIVRYYWLKIRKDCMKYMKKYEECQKFDNISHLPAEGLHNVMAPWPFVNLGSRYSWTFSLVKGQVKFLLVGIDHFTKWIKVEPVSTILVTLCSDSKSPKLWYPTMENSSLTRELRNSLEISRLITEWLQ